MTTNRIVIKKIEHEWFKCRKKSENTNFNINKCFQNISMEYRQQKFEGAFKPHKCQMANTKKKLKKKKKKLQQELK